MGPGGRVRYYEKLQCDVYKASRCHFLLPFVRDGMERSWEIFYAKAICVPHFFRPGCTSGPRAEIAGLVSTVTARRYELRVRTLLFLERRPVLRS